MVPWSIRRVMDLPPNAKLREMQQNTHGVVLSQPQSHNCTNKCSMRALYHPSTSLCAVKIPFCLPSNEWHNHMNLAFISTIMAPKPHGAVRLKSSPHPRTKLFGPLGGHEQRIQDPHTPPFFLLNPSQLSSLSVNHVHMWKLTWTQTHEQLHTVATLLL